MLRYVGIAVFIVLLYNASYARPEVLGKWRSETGNVFTITQADPHANGGYSLELYVVTKDGRHLYGLGKWITSDRLTSFSYTIKGIPGRAICRLDAAKNPDLITVMGPDGKLYKWARVKR